MGHSQAQAILLWAWPDPSAPKPTPTTWSEHAWLEDKNNPVPFSQPSEALRCTHLQGPAEERSTSWEDLLYLHHGLHLGLDTPRDADAWGGCAEHRVAALPQTLSSQEEQGTPSSKSALISSRLWALSQVSTSEPRFRSYIP